MKKLLAMVLVLSVMLGMLFVPSVSAAAVKEITLFETDFENETVGAAPVSVDPYGDSTENNAAVYEENGSKYIDTMGKGKNKRFRMLFNESVTSGIVAAEFDLNTSGAVALGMVYEKTPTTYAKWPFYVTGDTRDYAVKGFTATGGNPPSEEVSGKTVTFTKESDNANLTFETGKWQHYKVIFDFDNKSVTAYIDGVKSNTVTDYEYFGGTNDAIAGLAFYCAATDTETYKPSNKFDNIKIYKGYGNYLVDVDYDDGKIGGTANNETAKTYVKVDDSPAATGRNSKVLSFELANGAVRYPLPQTIKNEVFYVEFDVRAGFGGIGLALFGKDESHTTYQKYVFSSGTVNSTPKGGLKAYTEYGDGKKTHPSGNAGSETYIKGYRASGAASDMALSVNNVSAWNHVKLEVDLKNKRTRVILDGVASEYVEGYTYLDNLEVEDIAFKWSPSGISEYNEKTKAYIDNLKVYTIADEVYNVKIKDFTPSYSANETVTVSYDFTVTDFSSKDVELIVASYIGGELCDVNITSIENADKSGTKSASVTLTKACDEIRAFAWESGSLVPLSNYIAKQNTPSGN